MTRIEVSSTATSMGSALENVNFLWENKMVGRGGRDRSSSAVEILTLNFFIHCLQHYDAGFGPKIRVADGKPPSEFHVAQGTKWGVPS